jgi:transposase
LCGSPQNCPAQGKAVGLILPWCNTEAMNLQLAAISAKVEPLRHAMLLLDQAAWHMTPTLDMPSNISNIPLPAKCPELNPQENVWQYIRLSYRVFPGYENLVDHCCYAWNKLVQQPWTVMSIGLRS